jgi:hypothetical protein
MRLILDAIVGHARPMSGAGYGERISVVREPARLFTGAIAAVSLRSKCSLQGTYQRGSVALSMPLGLMFGRLGPPLGRAISSRCAATVRRSYATSARSFSTKSFSSACKKAVKVKLGRRQHPRINLTRSLL